MARPRLPQRERASRAPCLVARALCAAGLAAGVAACGGSASETPPPLEPDPRGFHYAPAFPRSEEASDAGDAPSPDVPSEAKAPRGDADR